MSEKVNALIKKVHRSNLDNSIDTSTGAYHRLIELVKVRRQKDLEN